jgi:hypothetical protein
MTTFTELQVDTGVLVEHTASIFSHPESEDACS